MNQVLVLPGDGIGPDITAEAVKVLEKLNQTDNLGISLQEGLVGGAAYDKTGSPLPQQTLELAENSKAILLGAVGGTKWESLDRELRPEKGLLGLRSHFDLFSNLRPSILYPELADSSSLKREVVAGLDIMIVRELVAGIYFGQPRGIEVKDGKRYGFNTASYTENQIIRIAHSAFGIAMKRGKKLTSVDKANVLEVSELWRDIMIETSKQYPEVELSHMYVDNAAMQLISRPKQFDTIVTSNMFGDILSDCAAELTGSIGMLPSASLNEKDFGMYEPIHGSAPDISGQNIANPIATILSAAMLCKYSLNRPELTDKIENSVKKVLAIGYRTKDIARNTEDKIISTVEMGDLIVENL